MEKKHNVTQPDTLQREWTRIVAQAWADPDFRKRLEKNPRAVLKERGVDVPGDVDLQVIDKPIEMEGIEQAVRPVPMAVAAGFAAPPMPMPHQASQFAGRAALTTTPEATWIQHMKPTRPRRTRHWKPRSGRSAYALVRAPRLERARTSSGARPSRSRCSSRFRLNSAPRNKLCRRHHHMRRRNSRRQRLGAVPKQCRITAVTSIPAAGTRHSTREG